MDQQLFRIEEAARILSLGRTKTYELITSGELQSVHIGRAIRVSSTALTDYINSLTAQDDSERLTAPSSPVPLVGQPPRPVDQVPRSKDSSRRRGTRTPAKRTGGSRFDPDGATIQWGWDLFRGAELTDEELAEELEELAAEHAALTEYEARGRTLIS